LARVRQKASHVFYRPPDGRTTTVPRHKRRDLAEIKSDVRPLKWITGTRLAGVLALVIRTFTS
jgi:hypothetical protein